MTLYLEQSRDENSANKAVEAIRDSRRVFPIQAFSPATLASLWRSMKINIWIQAILGFSAFGFYFWSEDAHLYVDVYPRIILDERIEKSLERIPNEKLREEVNEEISSAVVDADVYLILTNSSNEKKANRSKTGLLVLGVIALLACLANLAKMLSNKTVERNE